MAVSCNRGATWNQSAFIDGSIFYIQDLAVSPHFHEDGRCSW